jgi:hypothetical protein
VIRFLASFVLSRFRVAPFRSDRRVRLRRRAIRTDVNASTLAGPRKPPDGLRCEYAGRGSSASGCPLKSRSCRMHVLRNALARAGKGQRQMALAMINTVFAQESLDAAIAQWRMVADQLRSKFPRLAVMLDRSESGSPVVRSQPVIRNGRRQVDAVPFFLAFPGHASR